MPTWRCMASRNTGWNVRSCGFHCPGVSTTLTIPHQVPVGCEAGIGYCTNQPTNGKKDAPNQFAFLSNPFNEPMDILLEGTSLAAWLNVAGFWPAGLISRKLATSTSVVTLNLCPYQTFKAKAAKMRATSQSPKQKTRRGSWKGSFLFVPFCHPSKFEGFHDHERRQAYFYFVSISSVLYRL